MNATNVLPAIQDDSSLDDSSLDLPVSDFVSLPSRATLEAVLEISFYYLHKFMSRPDYLLRRAEHGCPVEFDLDHPERIPATYPAALVDELFQLYIDRARATSS